MPAKKSRNRKLFAFFIICLSCALLFTACGVKKESSKDIFAMDTFMNIKAYGGNADEAVQKCCDEIERLDALFDSCNEQSEIFAVNTGKDAAVSEDTYDIISRAVKISDMTDGAFDITVYPLIKAWGFTTDDHRVPDAAEIAELLDTVDSGRINILKDGVVSLSENTEIDLGGIAKGYASDRLMEIFEDYGLYGGIISLGGNVAAYGRKPDGGLWRVAIENPDPSISVLKNAEYVGVVKVSGKAVVTSGGYERYFEKDGVRYHHIIDPSTGYPAESGIISATVISKDGCLADALSTALFVMGKDKALDFWREYKESFDCILVDEDGGVFITKGIEDIFTSDLAFEVCE